MSLTAQMLLVIIEVNCVAYFS